LKSRGFLSIIKVLLKDQVDKAESAIRELIRHENDVVHQRLTWLIQSQGLLFAALAFAWQKAPALAIMLPVLGIATALSMWAAIANYSPAVRGLRNWWEINVSDEDKKGRLVIGRWAPSKGINKSLRPWRALPIIFIAAWIIVLLIRLLDYIAQQPLAC